MYERFTDASREVVRLAAEEASRWNHEYVGTEHVLIALSQSSSHPGGKILQECATDSDKLRSVMKTIVMPGPALPLPGRWARLVAFVSFRRRTQWTPRAKQLVERAVEAAREDGRNSIGTEHLLHGMLCDEESVAYQILTHQSPGIAKVRELVQQARMQTSGSQ